MYIDIYVYRYLCIQISMHKDPPPLWAAAPRASPPAPRLLINLYIYVYRYLYI